MAQANVSRDSVRDNIRKRQLRAILARALAENLTSPVPQGRMAETDSTEPGQENETAAEVI